MRVGPVDRGNEPIGEQGDIESKFRGLRVGNVFLLGQQVEQQGAEMSTLQYFRDRAIPRAVPATSASVGEDHQAARVWRQTEIAGERIAGDVQPDVVRRRQRLERVRHTGSCRTANRRPALPCSRAPVSGVSTLNQYYGQ